MWLGFEMCVAIHYDAANAFYARSERTRDLDMSASNKIWAVLVMGATLYLGISLMLGFVPSMFLNPQTGEPSTFLITKMLAEIGYLGAGLIIIFAGTILAALCLVSRNGSTDIDCDI